MERRLPGIIRFASRVLRDFFLRNHGLLLTAAVAFNMMLSLIPLSAVLIVIVSHFFDQTLLIETLTAEMALIAPAFTPILTDVLDGFLRTRKVVGWVGLGSLLVFSTFAFRVLEDAISIIFHQPLPTLKRKFWVSALMPYFFIIVVAVGLIAVTTINAIIDVQSQRQHFLFGFQISLHQHFNHLVYLTGLLGLVLLFTLFYQIMPVAKIPFRLALAGGLTATILWELVRHLVVSYYANMSMVNIVYGSMATIIIVLLTMEAVALILLLGAQVIADLHRSALAGVPWHEDQGQPPKSDMIS
jgi:membrane protein